MVERKRYLSTLKGWADVQQWDALKPEGKIFARPYLEEGYCGNPGGLVSFSKENNMANRKWSA
jgi:hypothetical protein